MPRLAPLVVCLLLLAGCGGGGDDGDDRLTSTTPKAERTATPSPTSSAQPSGPVTAAEERVIRGWSDALRNGRVNRAVSFWHVPATAYNGGPPLKLLSRDAIRTWNESLPCGAKLKAVERDSNYVLATFVLTNRKGFPSGCDGLGNEAQTLFLIRDGKILQWLRSPADAEQQLVPSEPS